MTKQVHERILSYYSTVPPEQGGILGEIKGIVVEYFHDDSSDITEKAEYVPNVEILNQVICQWNERGIRFCGIIHSHPKEQESLSAGDEEYIRSIMKGIEEINVTLYFPIIIPGDKIISYVVTPSEGNISITKDEIYILQEDRDIVKV